MMKRTTEPVGNGFEFGDETYDSETQAVEEWQSSYENATEVAEALGVEVDRVEGILLAEGYNEELDKTEGDLVSDGGFTDPELHHEVPYWAKSLDVASEIGALPGEPNHGIKSYAIDPYSED